MRLLVPENSISIVRNQLRVREITKEIQKARIGIQGSGLREGATGDAVLNGLIGTMEHRRKAAALDGFKILAPSDYRLPFLWG